MRLLIIILSVYIFSLNSLPCSDAEAESCEVTTTMTASEDEEHHDHDSSCPDDKCSPFCFCACCSVHINLYNTSTIIPEHHNSETDKNSCFYTQIYTNQFISALFRPPKLIV